MEFPGGACDFFWRPFALAWQFEFQWESATNFRAAFPDFQLEDELFPEGGRDVMGGRAYERRSRDWRRGACPRSASCFVIWIVIESVVSCVLYLVYWTTNGSHAEDQLDLWASSCALALFLLDAGRRPASRARCRWELSSRPTVHHHYALRHTYPDTYYRLTVQSVK